MKNTRRLLCAVAAAPFALVPCTVAAQESAPADGALEDVIIVTGTLDDDAVADTEMATPRQIALPADAAGIAARAPGAALIDNGALSGQVSYRGLFGERVLGTVNGQRFSSGGPNAMDPPMHYAPSLLVDHVSIARGVSPVSQGPALAGAVDAQLIETPFAEGEGTQATLRALGQYRSVDNSYALAGLAGVSSDTLRFGVIGSREEGDDYRFPGGTAVGTSFERDLYGVHGGAKLGEGELFAEYRRDETGLTGNPPFAMDIVYFDTDFVQGGYRGEVADGAYVELRYGHVKVRHLMDNQTLRKPPSSTPRATFADADTDTGSASLRLGTQQRNVTFGADFELSDKFVRITNPMDAAFFLHAQPGLSSQRFGGFVQWRGGVGPAEFELGGRIDVVEQDAGEGTVGSAVPMGPRNLLAAYNASARSADDTVFDAVVRAWVPGDVVTPRLVLARKTRVPSLLERFAWLPTEASYGLADGNIYVGNQLLKPEVAWIAELGADVQLGGLSLRPTAFYRRIDDYIQGTPFDATVGVIDSPVEMVANMNGDPTPLKFRNVDAELYGVDLDFSATVAGSLLIDGTASYVRGERRDIADNLYRVPPAQLRLAASWQGDGWSAGAEMKAAAAQDDVSVTNGEDASNGYAVFGLFADYALGENLRLGAGVENLFDATYRPHLAGHNRVGASDVALGERLPGMGRGVWVRLGIGF
tara:strand:- start:41910 stop:44018 length:2109 start_codon:yes stop_codon:yes gene_type:complete